MSDLSWVDEIERRAEAATPGPWDAEPMYDMSGSETGWHGVAHRGNPIIYDADRAEDATFIARAREDVPRLCRAVLELAEALDRVLASQWFDLPDGLKDEANGILERWRRGGA